jgi:predicted enzyme related to lactoylglutathione lyase
MEEKFKMHGAFSWCELTTADPEAAKKFYTELLGWTAEEMPMEGMTYTVLKAGEEGVGGIMPVPPEAQGTPAHWGAYITVNDVDAVAKKAQELGAKTLVPLTDVPDVGRLYTFQDPQGAVISVITYADMDQ